MNICIFQHGNTLLKQQELLDQERDDNLFRGLLILKDELFHVDRDVKEQATNAILLNVSIVVVTAVFKLEGLVVAEVVVVAHEEGRADHGIVVALIGASCFERLEAVLKAFALHGSDEAIDIEVFVEL